METHVSGTFQRVGTFSTNSPQAHAVFKYKDSAASTGAVPASEEQWEELSRQNESWHVNTLGTDIPEGPDLLYHGDPEVVEGFERFAPQIITII